MKNNQTANKFFAGLVGLFIIAFSINTTFGQDRMIPNKNGRLILNPNFSKVVKGNETETTYYFDVNPGEVVLEVNLQADVDIAGVNLSFRDRDGDEITEFVLAQQTRDESETAIIKTFTAHRKMRVFMTIQELSYGSRKTYPGKLSIKFGGTFTNIFKK
jgi:hypothetical protein